tara:strand:- start:1793 stop:3451 length:1659 start_codon:yes stop_codon:yes gene_type:complete
MLNLKIIFNLLLVILLIPTSFSFDTDTLTINPITFNTPSPKGWNAQYSTYVSFPIFEEKWEKILMVQTLKCDSLTAGDKYPCGEWDYIWSTFVEVPSADTTEKFCLGSFITPYGKRLEMGGENGWQWFYDITEYTPILRGNLKLTVGNNQELLDLKFHFIEGTPTRDIISIENIYPHGNYKYELLADDVILKKKRIVTNQNAREYEVKSIISGHGHEGPQNCCEWDSKTHTWYFNGWELFNWIVWTDCGNNPIYPQGGTWPFNRAGWCPGSIVDEYLFDLSLYINPGDTIELDYGIQNYYNNGEKEGNFIMTHQLISYDSPNFNHEVELFEIIAPNSLGRYSRLNPICDQPKIIIRNNGKEILKSVNIIYGFENKRNYFFKWYGELRFLESDTLLLPKITWNLDEMNFMVQLSNPNGTQDEKINNNKKNIIVPKVKIFPSEFQLSLFTNNNNRAKENMFTITDADGYIFYSGDNFIDSTEYIYDIKLYPGCYQFLFLDDMEDGISIHWWNRNSNPNKIGINGSINFSDINGKELHKFKPDFGQELRFNFMVE